MRGHFLLTQASGRRGRSLSKSRFGEFRRIDLEERAIACRRGLLKIKRRTMSDETLKVTAFREQEMVMTRVFKASRNLMFEALTGPNWSSVGFVGLPAGHCRFARSI